MSWLGLYKDLSRNTSMRPYWNKFTQELKSPEKFEHVWAKIEEFGLVNLSDTLRSLNGMCQSDVSCFTAVL